MLNINSKHPIKLFFLIKKTKLTFAVATCPWAVLSEKFMVSLREAQVFPHRTKSSTLFVFASCKKHQVGIGLRCTIFAVPCGNTGEFCAMRAINAYMLPLNTS